ncbi:hypothetical protein EDB89DRAFT_888122 [Lactarius sanguifluus]|nr:hypothetical protein EDB89DRAFT_888122 [Lactarius sanguifluus]
MPSHLSNCDTKVCARRRRAEKNSPKATEMLDSYSERSQSLDLPLSIYSRMEIAKQKDNEKSVWSHAVGRATLRLQKFWDNQGPTMTINFVLLRSPLLSSHDPDIVIVRQEFNIRPPLSEVLWNFSRYNDRARVTLEQNPHFYLDFPADESAYTPMFQCRPLHDLGALKHNDTVYVLSDGPGRVFLDIEHKHRVFGNVWSPNGTLIFRDRFGVLEGEQLVRGSRVRGNLWYCEQQVVFHGSQSRLGSRFDRHDLRPIVTMSSADHPAGGVFEDWTALNHLASRSILIHIYSSQNSPGPTSSPDLPPPLPPISEQPGYPVYYTTINTLSDDILLDIFAYYRLDEENGWNVWCKLSHICRRWRHLVHYSAFHLGMYILCTNGCPTLGTLDHLPPLPLFVDYQGTITQQDESAIRDALLLRDRVSHIDLHLPPSILHKFLMLMDEPFSVLKHLSLSSSTDEDTRLVLPRTFLAPNLCHLALLGINLPKRLRFLFSTVSLVTLTFTNIRASGYFHPRLLAARLQFLSQLERLSIGFSIPIPRPRAETELLDKRGMPVTLPNLKHLTFQGVSAYLECLVAQISAPHLKRLEITLFNQIAFSLPHLSHFTNIIEAFKLPAATVFFGSEVTIAMDHYITQQYGAPFTLRVRCNELDWQVDCAAQICSALMPALFGVEELGLRFHEQTLPTEWQNGEIDGTTWHELLRAFVGARQLRLCVALSQELSHALQVGYVGSEPGLLPSLWEIVSESHRHARDLFSSFIDARRIAGRPVAITMEHETTIDDILKPVARLRILSIGRSGVGKSSLINSVFGINAAYNADYKPGEADIQQEFVSPENQFFVLHDSKGFEPGDLSNFERVRKFIQQRTRPELPLSERIHVVWLCTETPTAGGRVFESGDEKLLQFVHNNQVPIVIVFTQYDRLVRTKEYELREEHPHMNPTRRRDRGVEEAQKAFEDCLKSVRRTMNRLGIPMPPYATVSVRPGHQEDVSSLVKVTRNVVKERLKYDTWELWAIAQRRSLPVKIDVCITKVIGYYRSLMDSRRGAPESRPILLRDCIGGLHNDIITCWNFKGEVLNSPEFRQLMLCLVQDVHTKPNVSMLVIHLCEMALNNPSRKQHTFGPTALNRLYRGSRLRFERIV